MAKDAYYFSHDSNARNDPKILRMRRVYKSEGYGWYWALVEMLRDEEDYKLCIEDGGNALAMQMQCEENAAHKFIADCITPFELFESDGTHFWSNSLMRRMERKEEKSEKARQAALSRWEKKDNANAMQTHSERNALKESKVKESKAKETIGSVHTTIAHLTPITVEQHGRLVDKYGLAMVEDVYDSMRNSTGLKKYKDGYLTANNWCRVRQERQPKAKQPGNLTPTDSYDDAELILRRMQKAAAGKGRE